MKRLFSILLVGFVMLLAGCTPNDEPKAMPELSLSKGKTTQTTLSFTVETKSVDNVAYVYTDDVTSVPAASVVLSEGIKLEGNKVVEVVIDKLEADVTYTIVVAASGGGEVVSKSIDMTTAKQQTEAETITLEFDGAVRAQSEEYTDAEYALVFTSSEAELTLVLEAEDVETLPEGVYRNNGEVLKLNLDKSVLVMAGNDAEYTFVTGEVSVSVDAEQNYTFDITLANATTILEASYEGVVEGMVEPTPEPEDVVFAAAKSTWKGQYHSLVFTTADESVKLVADIYTYHSKYGYLYEGVYTVKNSGYSFSAGEIDYYYSSFTVDGEKSTLDSGTIEVAINDDLSYSIAIDVAAADGRALKGSYDGVIEGMSFENGFEWLVASRNTLVDSAAGQFNITFKTAGSESADSITLDFYAAADAERLPAGRYTIANSTDVGCVNLETLIFTTFSNGTPEIDGGEVVVESLGGNDYKVAFRMTEKDSRRTWVCSYEGEIYNMVIETGAEELNFVSANGYYSDDSAESYVYLVADNGKQLKLDLVDLAWQSAYITPGTYAVETGWAPGGICSGWYGTSWSDGVNLKSGSAIFEDNGDQTYTITVNITLTNDDVCAGVYVGAIDGFTLPKGSGGGTDGATVELAVEYVNAQIYGGGNYALQLFTPGSGWTETGAGQSVAYLQLDLYNLNSSLDYIAAGTYVVAGTSSGQMDPTYTKVMPSASKAVSGDATFAINADKSYTINFAITCDDGVTYTGSYTGNIINITVTDNEDGDEQPTATGIVKAEGKKYSGNNFGVQLITKGSSLGNMGDGQTYAYINLDLYNITSGLDYIAAGAYNLGGAKSGELDKAYTKISYGTSEKKATSGWATFAINADKSYTITFDLTFADGMHVADTFTGYINGISVE